MLVVRSQEGGRGQLIRVQQTEWVPVEMWIPWGQGSCRGREEGQRGNLMIGYQGHDGSGERLTVGESLSACRRSR